MPDSSSLFLFDSSLLSSRPLEITMPYTNNQAKKDAKAAQKLESSFDATAVKAKEASTNTLSKPAGMKGQKENAAPIHNASKSSKANGGKGPKDKVTPFQEPSSKSHVTKGQNDKASIQVKGSKRGEAKSKAGKA